MNFRNAGNDTFALITPRAISARSGRPLDHVHASRIWIAYRSDLSLEATVPAGATTGALAVQRDSGSRVYTAAYFTVVGAGPYITDFSPTFGGSNTLVVINGVHFTGVAPSGVKFNGVAARDAADTAYTLALPLTAAGFWVFVLWPIAPMTVSA